MNADQINKLIKEGECNTNAVSDGYHTFGELYEHRIELYLALCRIITHDPRKRDSGFVWKSKIHSDGSIMNDWFLLGIGTEAGNQITYHLPMSKWEDTWFASVLEEAVQYDGHNSNDVLKRLKDL